MQKGTRIRIIGGGVMVGVWYNPGDEGVIEEIDTSPDYPNSSILARLYRVRMDKDGKLRTLAADEFECVPKGGT